MSTVQRAYAHAQDYRRVDDFLSTHYQPGNLDGNWLEPMWEYMHGHPYLDQGALGQIGLWEDDGQLVAVAHYEARPGEAFFQFHPAYRHLRQAMLEYAEQNLSGGSQRDGPRALRAYINELDEDFQSLARARDYQREPESDRPLFQVAIPQLVPAIRLPAGFHLTSLADECDWARVQRVLWRGFNHDGEPPAGEGELESRRKMFDTPSARRELKIVVTSPAGDFVSFCGMFYVPTHQFAYVEPVATDPAFRRMGLGKAAVLEDLRRCGALGATVAYVGSDQAFYQALGFTRVFTSECWVKHFEDGP